MYEIIKEKDVKSGDEVYLPREDVWKEIEPRTVYADNSVYRRKIFSNRLNNWLWAKFLENFEETFGKERAENLTENSSVVKESFFALTNVIGKELAILKNTDCLHNDFCESLKESFKNCSYCHSETRKEIETLKNWGNEKRELLECVKKDIEALKHEIKSHKEWMKTDFKYLELELTSNFNSFVNKLNEDIGLKIGTLKREIDILKKELQ